MAAPGTRMRLTVVVESLAEENAHGLYRDEALEAFKERKFAMPLQLDDTFETVWNEIEQRYKTNYLNARQAAAFSIKKLQDAYDCDLDMTDTVGSIFEGEPDRKMHMIKVIPHFVYRETSVVPGSKLRPSGAQKRHGDDVDQGTNKRRRVESQRLPSAQEERDPSPNRPILSTEAQPVAPDRGEDVEAEGRSVRSKSGMSLVELGHMVTGQVAFSSIGIKQESPEPEQSPELGSIDAAPSHKPFDRRILSASEGPVPNGGRATSRSETSRVPSEDNVEQPVSDELQEPDEAPGNDTNKAKRTVQAAPELVKPPEMDAQEVAILKSPVSSSDVEPRPAPTTRQRRDVYQVPSSPEFMQMKDTPDKPAKIAKTYGRSPRSAQTIQKEVDMLNMARQLPRKPTNKAPVPMEASAPISKKARAFQRLEHDDIQSTPQEAVAASSRRNGQSTSDEDEEEADLTASFLDEAAEDEPHSIQTSARHTLGKSIKPGSLKRPSRKSLIATPARVKRGTQCKAASTPATRASATKPVTKSKTATPSIAATPSNNATPKSEKVLSAKTQSRMEYLQKLLDASQCNPRPRTGTASPARSGSAKSRDRSDTSSPEIRVPVTTQAAPVTSSVETPNTQLPFQPPAPQFTLMKSPVPLPLNTRRLTSTKSRKAEGIAKAPNESQPDHFKKPVARLRKSPAMPSPARKISDLAIATTPRRSQVPLPPNLCNLERGSTSKSSPLANGHTGIIAENFVKDQQALSSVDPGTIAFSSTEPKAIPEPIGSAGKLDSDIATNPINDAIVISSAESSSTDYSNSDDEQQQAVALLGKDSLAGAANISTNQALANQTDETAAPSDDISPLAQSATEGKDENQEEIEVMDDASNVQIAPQSQHRPPSGQESSQATPWSTETWDFDSLTQPKNDAEERTQVQQSTPRAASPTVALLEDEGFAGQELYSTAIEDNTTRSRSASAAVSTRSSPAVSRRPARFLSHSPTPDASDSEDDFDAVSTMLSQAASPQANNDKGESESESSSDSSEDEDVKMPDLPAESTTDSHTKGAPPSSPPINATTNSTPAVLETSRFTPSQLERPLQKTPVPLPTQQSSQAPRSSQSVSVQAADRRRYTGFRSLREQLADTKAAHVTTQTKTFDPRTMNLGKLAQTKPLMDFGGNDNESSDEESSSSSESE
ncbi:hypothetical protein N0V94_008844 [Neodidymelliopsis sp. IMI 364377]|nr:hypothetical protein N0V94_008844 [Neodidymelliopsis sp. IMI 364377]